MLALDVTKLQQRMTSCHSQFNVIYITSINILSKQSFTNINIIEILVIHDFLFALANVEMFDYTAKHKK